LPRVTEIRHGGSDASGRGASQRVDHDHHLHQVVVGWRAGRLQHKHILAADVLEQLDSHLTVGESTDVSTPQRNAEVLSDSSSQLRVGIAGKHHQGFE